MARKRKRSPINSYGGVEYQTADGTWHKSPDEWDLIIAHPPCTYLTVSGNAHFVEKRYGAKALGRYMDRLDGIKFFMEFVCCNAKRVAIENPIGIMSNVYKKPDQIIEPWMFGHHASKKTCLWLRNLPLLEPTDVVDPGEYQEASTGSGRKYNVGSSSSAARDENGKILAWNDPRTAIIRSRTYTGIAKAMAEQWG